MEPDPNRQHPSKGGVGPDSGSAFDQGPKAEPFSLDEELTEHLDIEILERIGAGATGAVFLGRQKFLDRIVAVKVSFLPQGDQDLPSVKRFEREAKVLASLHHPGIVTCYHAGATSEGQQFLVMDLIDGPTLKKFVDDNGPLASNDALGVIRKLALALQYALKQNIIHCDLKPANVLLDPESSVPGSSGFPFEPKLSDLGMARSCQLDISDEITLTEVTLGTPQAVSPEQLENAADLDCRSDLYALGAVLYFMLTGNMPFQQSTIAAILKAKRAEEYTPVTDIVPDVPPATEKLLAQLLAADPAKRPKSYEELISRIDEVLASPPKAARTEQVTSGAAAKQSGGKGKAVAAGVAVVVLLGIGAGVLLMRRNSGEESAVVSVQPSPPPAKVEIVQPEPTIEISPAAIEPVPESAVEPAATVAEAPPVQESAPQEQPASLEVAAEPISEPSAPLEDVPQLQPIIDFNPLKSPIVISEVLIRSEPANAEAEFIELRSVYPGMSLNGYTLEFVRGKSLWAQVEPGTVTHQFEFGPEDRTNDEGFFLLCNDNAARDYNVKPQKKLAGSNVIEDDALTVLLIQSAAAPKPGSVVPANKGFGTAILDSVTLGGSQPEQQVAYFGGPVIPSDEREVVPGAIRVSRQQADGTSLTGWIPASKYTPPTSYNTPGAGNSVPDTLLESSSIQPALAVLSEDAATPVPTPTPRETWSLEEFDTLFGRISGLKSSVIYFRLKDAEVSKKFETECLLDESVAELMAGREKIFVNVTSQDQLAKIKRAFGADKVPCLVVYNSTSSIKSLTVTKDTNLTDIGMFLMAARQ